MAGGTSPPHGATRFIETTRGVLSYAQLAPLLAERALVLERMIAERAFAGLALSPELILELHRRLCADLVPDWGGRWRNADVQVGMHTPPPSFRVASLILDYVADLTARFEDPTAAVRSNLLTEHLAFAEGRLLSIHPFADFNGRVTRLWLRELLCRLDLPDLELVPADPTATAEYLQALHAADQMHWSPLASVWARRLEAGFQGPSAD